MFVRREEILELLGISAGESSRQMQRVSVGQRLLFDEQLAPVAVYGSEFSPAAERSSLIKHP